MESLCYFIIGIGLIYALIYLMLTQSFKQNFSG